MPLIIPPPPRRYLLTPLSAAAHRPFNIIEQRRGTLCICTRRAERVRATPSPGLPPTVNTHTHTHTKASVTASSQSHLLPHRQVFASRIFFHLALFLTYFTPKRFTPRMRTCLPLKSPPSESCSCARRACNTLAHFLPCVSEQSQRNSSV